jgi:ABC-type dipeptide/oligopeptide/nickel transport system ATPase component
VVLDHGRVVEEATGTRLLTKPQHRVTRSLLAASGRNDLFAEDVPVADPPIPLSPTRTASVGAA